MERAVSLEDISDGKLYGINDMVRADSGGCEGCSACCRKMGTSIIRFVTDWATQQRDVDMLIGILEEEHNPTLACVS